MIIVGAGPVGLSLAIGLSRRGVPSTIIEKNEDLEPYSRAILVPARTLDIFQEWDILSTMLDAGIYVPQLRVYDARSSRPIIALDFSDLKDVTETPGFLFLPQDRIERLLLAAVRSSRFASVQFGAAATGFEQTSEGVTVSVQDHGQSYEIAGRFLVGCDGAHSVTRQRLGLSLHGKTFKARVLIADIELDAAGELPTPRLAVTAGGPLVLLKFDENRWRIVGTVQHRETEEEARSEAGVGRRVRALAGDAPFRLLWSSTFQIHNRLAQKMRVTNVFLAGDAV
ncbi:MAG: FAD-dependent monooxygenase, partial [Candidatus Eremiobacteraeota bacterium]|nr:FAD-dependent monooxygenase [Candidatus Eremiobacteraeota bacterium]